MSGSSAEIDRHTFDAELFRHVARHLPEVRFVLVGSCSLPDGWFTEPNVFLVGQRPYAEVAAYMAAFDVLIMPWNQNEWIRACNPVKLKEYLAVGRPIVSTPFPELDSYEGLIETAHEPGLFAEKVQRLINTKTDPARGRDRVRSEGWDTKAREVLGHLAAGRVQMGGCAMREEEPPSLERLPTREVLGLTLLATTEEELVALCERVIRKRSQLKNRRCERCKDGQNENGPAAQGVGGAF